MSPGTTKTSVEGLAQGGKARKDGRIPGQNPVSARSATITEFRSIARESVQRAVS